MTAIPTLSTVGVITSLVAQLDKLISYTFVADAGQNHLFGNNILSISKLWQENTQRPDLFESMLSQRMTSYLEGYYSRVTVKVSSTKNDADEYTVAMKISVYSSDAEAAAADWRFETSGSSLTQIASLLNTGT